MMLGHGEGNVNGRMSALMLARALAVTVERMATLPRWSQRSQGTVGSKTLRGDRATARYKYICNQQIRGGGDGRERVSALLRVALVGGRLLDLCRE